MDRLMLSKNKRSRGDQSGNAPIPDSPNRKTNKNPIFIKDIMSFDDGAVGLGIVAAMSGGGGGGVCAPPARSEPIPIVSSRAGGYTLGSWEELSESYTCVISHARGNPVRKRVYFGDGSDGSFGKFVGNSGVFFQSPSPAAEISPAAVGFLSRCCLCKKKLQGLDIFMYRGEKAFCSEECRYKHIMSDQEREKWRLKPRNPIEYSVSPCSDSLFFAAGVAAA